MLVAQACEFHKRYPDGMPPPDRFKNPVVDDALPEATLVHLRLLDDFLRSEGDPRSVRAQEWVSQHDWQPRKDWLKPEIPKRISQQVAHLSQQRDAWFEWDIRDYAHRCCRELESFVGAVKRYRPDRSPAFAVIERRVADGLECLDPSRRRL